MLGMDARDGFLPTSSRYSWSNDHFSHVVTQCIVNDCRFAHGFYFSAGGSFARIGLGHAYTTFSMVKHLLERTKLCSSCLKSCRDTILVCWFGGYVSWGVLFNLQVGCTVWPMQI